MLVVLLIQALVVSAQLSCSTHNSGTWCCTLYGEGIPECIGYPPVTVPESGSYKDLAVSNTALCLITRGGELECVGTQVPSGFPRSGYERLLSTDTSFCALTSERSYCWGSVNGGYPSSNFSLGEGGACWILDTKVECTQNLTPPRGEFLSVAVGDGNVCGITSEYRIVCTLPENHPVNQGFYRIHSYKKRSCAWHVSEGMVCWTSSHYRYNPPTWGVYYTQIALTYSVSCGVTSQGEINCWDLLYKDGYPVYFPPPQLRMIMASEKSRVGVDKEGYLVFWGNRNHGIKDLIRISEDENIHFQKDTLCVYNSTRVRCYGRHTGIYNRTGSISVTESGIIIDPLPSCHTESYSCYYRDASIVCTHLPSISVPGFRKMVCSEKRICYLRDTGSVACQPPLTITAGQYADLDLSESHLVLLTTSGDITSIPPIPVFTPGPWKSISAGYYAMCAIHTNGGYQCWGDMTDSPSQRLPVPEKRCLPGYKNLYPYSRDSVCEGPYLAGRYGKEETLCPSGHYCPYGSEKPIPCTEGTYLSREGSASNDCIPCSLGYSCGEGSSKPSPCPPGSYGDGKVCQSCESGKYAPQEAMISCLTCPPGKYSDSGSSVCTDCPAGKYGNGVECYDCPQSHYSSSGQSVCTLCETIVIDNQCWKPNCTEGEMPGKGHCLPCPPGSWGDGSSCHKCSAGSYTMASGSSDCHLCTHSLHCSEGIASPRRGWWMYNNSDGSVDTVPCLPTQCIEYGCKSHRRGYLCSECEEGYTNWYGECLPCQSPGLAVSLSVLVQLVIIGYLYRSSRTRPGVLGVMVYFLQASSIMIPELSIARGETAYIDLFCWGGISVEGQVWFILANPLLMLGLSLIATRKLGKDLLYETASFYLVSVLKITTELTVCSSGRLYYFSQLECGSGSHVRLLTVGVSVSLLLIATTIYCRNERVMGVYRKKVYYLSVLVRRPLLILTSTLLYRKDSSTYLALSVSFLVQTLFHAKYNPLVKDGSPEAISQLTLLVMAMLLTAYPYPSFDILVLLYVMAGLVSVSMGVFFIWQRREEAKQEREVPMDVFRAMEV